jgi:hypothetical protein
MRRLLIALLLITALVAGLTIYFIATTPATSVGVRFPLSAADRALIASVPAGAESFAIIPTAAVFEGKLRANPVTGPPLEEWAAHQMLPAPWMVGAADLLVWREEKQTRYFVRLDPLRAMVVRLYLILRGDSGGTLLINAPPGGGLPPDEVTRIVALADALPAGDALIVQRGSGHSYPPIGRPAVTSLQITGSDVVLTSHAANDSSVPAGPLQARLARGAMVTIAFASPPRALNDLNRLLGAKVSGLLDGGGALAIYDVETRKLLPRPLAVIVLPADAARRAALEAFVHTAATAEAVGVRVRTGERDGQLLLSFDDSLDLYIKDATDAAAWPSARWALRMDPRRLVPVMEHLHDAIGLRIAAPHVYQSVRDLDRWVGALSEAGSIEAVDTVDGQVEQLQVRIAGGLR